MYNSYSYPRHFLPPLSMIITMMKMVSGDYNDHDDDPHEQDRHVYDRDDERRLSKG